jgi:hypothetical protein
MIKASVKIREKTLKDSSEVFLPEKYPDNGFFVVTDESGTYVKQLVYVGSNNAASMPTVYYIGDWEYLEKYFVYDKDGMEDVSKEMNEVQFQPINLDDRAKVSEEFALDMLSVAMHGKKAK